MIKLLIFVLVSYISTQQAPNLPNVILSGEPRVISRRILHVDLRTAEQLSHPDHPEYTRQRVNVRQEPSPTSGDSPCNMQTKLRPVTVYKRILRPARVVGGGIDPSSLQPTGEAIEVETWTSIRQGPQNQQEFRNQEGSQNQQQGTSCK
ncbi:hypothetical protein GCK72_008724 [Caenorhabditis remanei]|uniref:Uncharacterized protein n=1 Tax=Caenorhabditis remanei TaxID=31234 RepID=A0A6A5H0S1_CAERE|nr:hypothetical protein GCK72_008724 [Caenorhabditis remanei]KAF1760475.1 hypothetical protein GCK72_008724 [Caenorhabditis remanei]